jgi:hypothetical protein
LIGFTSEDEQVHVSQEVGEIFMCFINSNLLGVFAAAIQSGVDCEDYTFPQLDNAFPYGYNPNGQWLGTVFQTNVPNDTAQDSSGIGLPSYWGEVARSFQATMYLMWAPTPDPRCTGSSCTLMVPLGSAQWNWAGDVIDTQIFRTNMAIAYPLWMPNYEAQSYVVFQKSNPGNDPNNSFPIWGTNNVDTGELGSCH